MSIFGALFSGVSGLNAQAQAMGIISDNISNVNTIGYKKTATQFSTLVTQSATVSRYSPGGVRSAPNQLIDRQGLLQASASATDLAIAGNGFFVVNTEANPTAISGDYRYTRAGSFSPDENGNLRNAAGLYLRGWKIDDTGNITTNRSDLTATETVNIRGLTGSATPSTEITLKANLQASQSINTAVSGGTYSAGDIANGTTTPDFERSVQIFDSQGQTHTLTFGMLKNTTANQWLTEIYVKPASDVNTTAHPNGLIASGTIAFNADGSLDLTNTSNALKSLTIQYAASSGVSNSSLTIDYGTDGKTDGFTQFDAPSQLISSDVNGAVFGTLRGVEVNEDGVMTAIFDNGTRQDIYKLPIATFPNANGLGNKSGNAYIQTSQSGDFTLNEAGIGGAGKIAPSALEASTVDLAEEFADMIITQRAYSASGKVITTADQMLDELIRLKR